MTVPRRPSNFTQIIKPLLLLMTIPGFRPFAIPGESYVFKKFSIVGVVFWAPVPLLTGYVLYNCLKALISFSKTFGLFDGRTIFYIVIILFTLFQFIYVLITLLYASKIYACLAKLDTISLNARNHERFVKLFYVTLLSSTTLLIAICAIIASSSVNILLQAGTAVPFWTYLSAYEMTSAMIAFKFPLLFLMFMAYYLGLAFDENIDRLKVCQEHQLEKQLPELYSSYLNLAKATNVIDDFFSLIVLGSIGVNGTILCLFLLNIAIFTTLPTAMLIALILLVLGNFFGYSFYCSWLNDKSRAIRDQLHEIRPTNQNIHQWLECFQRKVTDYDWGLTIGKLVLLERTAVLTICGALTTFIAFYAQFNTSDPSKSDFKQININQLLDNTA